ncbi:MAG: EF-P lysine aminoacylase GenX [Alphaproteobacteria bacterium]|nr:EF-P lysine aminoacylase GenX [Alphaproteobacteria bacterium]
MSWWQPQKFESRRQNLKTRMALIKAVRRFFDDQGFWEVETPALQVSPCAEAHLHGFKTRLLGTDLQPVTDLYLHTSPEFAMKKLMVAGVERLYQICHVYRNGESSSLHSPEFSMIEWYRTGVDYEAIMEDCIGLLRAVAQDLGIAAYRHKDKNADPFKDWQKITVAEAFQTYADIDLERFLDDAEGLAAAAREQGLRVTPDYSWDDVFFAVMDERIEPSLGHGVPTILYDYPAHMAALSRKKTDDPRFAERFELYVCGIELANAFSELTDAAEQRARFEAEMALKKQLYGQNYPVDEDFLKALEYGMPESGGIALGIDRLVMLATGAEDIIQTQWVSPSQIDT